MARTVRRAEQQTHELTASTQVAGRDIEPIVEEAQTAATTNNSALGAEFNDSYQ